MNKFPANEKFFSPLVQGGLRCWCRRCSSKKSGEYYRKNKKAITLWKKKYATENAEKIAKSNKAYFFRNRDIILSKSRLYYVRNRKKILANKKINRTKTKVLATKTAIAKLAARKIARKAIASGAIKRTACISCGDKNTEAHHKNYSKPLDVMFFCHPCHMAHHAGIEPLQKLYPDHYFESLTKPQTAAISPPNK